MKHARSDYNRFQDPAGIIPEDEPVLILRGQDWAAPVAARAWADEHDRRGGDPGLSRVVRKHAEAMEAWPVKKAADAPADAYPEEP